MRDIPQQPPHAPLIVNDTDDKDITGCNNDDKDAESNNSNGCNNNDDGNLLGKDSNDKPADLAAATGMDDN